MATRTHRNTTPTHVKHELVVSSGNPTYPTDSSTDRIRGRAYEIYEQRRQAGRPGDELSDWIQAERELTDRSASLAYGEVASAVRT